MCVCVCLSVCLSVCPSVRLSVIISLCSWVIFVYVDAVYWFYGCSFLCLIGCFSKIVWTPTGFECFIYMRFLFCICTCSAQLSMFQIQKCSRNTLNIIIIIINLHMDLCLFNSPNLFSVWVIFYP